MRTGDLSKLTTASGSLIPIYDPNTATYDGNGNIVTSRSAFPGNKIPTNRLDPVALAVS